MAERRAAASAVLPRLGGEPLGAEPGEAWARGRFSAPYLRDSLLDAGATVETLETAGFWSGLPRLYDAVRLARCSARSARRWSCATSPTSTRPAPRCTSPSSRRRATTRSRSGSAAKAAANEAIIAAGGTITHHHGVGSDHRDGYAAEIGPLGTAILRAVKHELDPAGILNPGVLIP